MAERAAKVVRSSDAEKEISDYARKPRGLCSALTARGKNLEEPLCSSQERKKKGKNPILNETFGRKEFKRGNGKTSKQREKLRSWAGSCKVTS